MTTREALRESLELWRKLFQLLRFSSRNLSLAVAGLTMLEAIAGIVVLYMIKRLVDDVSEELGTAEAISETGWVFGYLGLIGVVMVLSVAVQRLAEYLRQRQGTEVADHVDRQIHARAIAVDLCFYESPRYYDSLQRARAAGSQRPALVITTLAQFMRSSIFLVAVFGLMATLDWRLVPLLLLSMSMALVVRLRFTRIMFRWKHRRAQMERRAGYLDWLLTSEHHAKELRIGRLGGELQDRYSKLRRKIRGEQLAIEKRKSLAEVAAAAIGALVFFGATAWLVMRVIDGSVGLGDLVLFLLLFRRAETSGREFVSALSGVYDHQLFLTQLFDFLSVQPRLVAPARPTALPEPVREGIVFHQVGFSYTGNAKPALSGIDFTLPAGKVTAIVGENGSGKTSFIKLLCRLYDPDVGRITLDGIDIRDFSPEAYRRLFSVIFQDYARYAETVAENIRFGDVLAAPEDQRIVHAANLGGIHDFVSDLPKGMQTPLTRLFDDGSELSTGQWQRVALSRAFFPNSQFIIMDEPTSAVDPRAEADLFENFRERLEGRGALVVSHRLSTIRLADQIYLLEKGQIIEHGTHDALMALQGSYAKLFARQARSFAPTQEKHPTSVSGTES